MLPRFVEKIESGKMKFLGRGDKVLNNTYVENLVDAIFLAIDSPDALGETFNIHDERLVTREEFVNTIADYLGKPHPRHIPEWVARTMVKPIEGMARMRGATKPPLLTAAQIKFMTLNLDYSIAKAKRVLGFAPRVDFREGIRIALDDFKGKKAAAQPQPKRRRFSCEPSIAHAHPKAHRLRRPAAAETVVQPRHGDAAESENVFIRCELADGTVGWGEGVPRSYVTGETPTGCIEQLAATPVGEQLGADCNSWAGRDSALRRISAGDNARRPARLLWQRAAVRGGAEHLGCVRPAVWRAGERCYEAV